MPLGASDVHFLPLFSQNTEKKAKKKSKRRPCLRVHSNNLIGRHAQFEVDEIQKFDNVSQKLLRDALARAINGELHVGRREYDGGGEHGHAYGFAETPRCGHQNLLRRGVPPVQFQHPIVVDGECARPVPLEKDSCARFQVLLVKHSLVKASIPAAPVKRIQRVSAQLDPLDPVEFAFVRGHVGAHVPPYGRLHHALLPFPVCSCSCLQLQNVIHHVEDWPERDVLPVFLLARGCCHIALN